MNFCNKTRSDLAIVIPAYKSIFFDQALLSIANQTCKDFTLYIGNDNSSSDLKRMIDKYKYQIPIIYKHFNENLGGKDLVAQWERCIDLVRNEEWIWLFSDDDFIDPTCVENFYQTLHQYPNFDLYHFNVLRVDEFNDIVDQFYIFPEVLTSEEFLSKRLKIGYFSTVVEYVFRKTHFYDKGRFQNFDLAWCSDDATWIKLGKKKGIRTIYNSNVYWRESQFNISGNNLDMEIHKRKLYSQIEFTNWICSQTLKYEINLKIIPLKQQLKVWLLQGIKLRIKFLSFGSIALILAKIYLVLDEHKCPRQKILLLYIFKVYLSFKGILMNIMYWKYFKFQRLK